MMDRTAVGPVLFVILIVLGMAVPTMALSANTDEPSAGAFTAGQAEVTAQTQTTQSNARVNAKVGPQLSTVIDVSSDEVQTEFDNTAFELSVEAASDDAKAQAIADRAAELRDRADAIRRAYDAATEAYESGKLTNEEYARRLAVLNARATNLHNSYEQLQARAATLSSVDAQTEDSLAALNRSVANLSRVSGTGTTALLRQFTGEAEGDFEVEFENGLSIEVESEDGERYREFERPGDDSDRLTIEQATALKTARNGLSSDVGTWVLTDSEIEDDDGTYEFAFALRNASTLTGEAEVTVDGSSGDIVSFEEAIERREADDDEDEREEEDAEDERDDDADSDREVAIVVIDGTPGPNERVTIQVRAGGAPVDGATVFVNDNVAGTTDADGRLTVTLPATEKVEITVETDDDSAELEFEFAEHEESEESAEETESVGEEDDEAKSDDAETEPPEEEDAEPDD